MTIDDAIPDGVSLLKRAFMRGYKSEKSVLSEVIPLCYSESLPISNNMLGSLHRFARVNSIYLSSWDAEINGIACRIYEGDINNYWLSSKKHDTSYQAFYPTWMLSAFALALKARSLGFNQLIDIGSGDGRIAYCARLLGMEAFGIEIDHELVELQNKILAITDVNYHVIRADATDFDYSSLDLSCPIFFISGLPEMGEMLANTVIRNLLVIEKIKHKVGFNFMGSHVLKPLTRDRSGWGWGSIIKNFDLRVVCTLTLPTLWTNDQVLDTAYVYTKVC